MEVKFRLTKFISPVRTTIHLVFPNASPPFNATKSLKLNENVPFKVSGTCVLGIVHVYNDDSLLSRFMFVPVFNKEQNLEHNITYTIATMDDHKNITLVPTTNANFLSNINSNLDTYIRNQYNLIESLSPCNEIIRRKHSLFWELDLNNGKMKIPYVTLAMKGNNLLQNIKLKKIKTIRNFFIKELYSYFEREGKKATDFTTQSFKAANDPIHKHAVLITIANFFSQLIHKYVDYKSDYIVTGKMDYVGLNLIHEHLMADCEDQATCAYNAIRLFRNIFPSNIEDIKTPSLTVAYHVSAWLNASEVAIFQGSVQPHKGEEEINHVWCAIMPTGSPFVFVEATSESADISKYKTLIHAWMYKSVPVPEIYDLFFINPHNNTYGLPISDLVYEKNASEVFQAWGRNQMQKSYKADIMFASHITTETFSIFENVV